VVEHLAKVAAIHPATAPLASVEVFGFVFDWRPLNAGLCISRVEYRSLVGRKLGQQMRPVALHDAANFRIDFRNVIEPGFNLPPDQFQFFGVQRTAMQKFNRHIRVTRQS
jgi:hypothetical protein